MGDNSITLAAALTATLQWACRWGQLDAISLLLENGANPDNLDVTNEPDGLRPCLEVAASANLPAPMRDKVVNLLLEKGATPTTLGLLLSAELPSSVAVAKTFQSKNLALDFSTRSGENLLMVAVNAKNVKLVQFLLLHIDAARADIWGRTLPIIAAYTGCTAMFDIVVEHIMRKCNNGKELIEASDKDGRTALMYACMRGHVNIAVALIEHYDGNLSQRDRWNDCALSFSIIHGLNAVTKKLEEKLQTRLPRGEVQFVQATPERDLATNTRCERQGCVCTEIFVRWDLEWRDRRCCMISDERLETLRRTWMGRENAKGRNSNTHN
ncbi:hypothetical protein NLG97_g1192 [Lecanicillium saksenae]|uniref:Uncharacterized protein n=1 Tax=Lecanicillium saksenae TaxID=468837 RepID=A0ACC1R735_9HYPO|nr:hypothetical protein NLG97_g1192 [Lecanicillium saksenae]